MFKKNFFLISTFLIFSSPSYGFDSSQELAELKKQVETLMHRINDLEKKQLSKSDAPSVQPVDLLHAQKTPVANQPQVNEPIKEIKSEPIQVRSGNDKVKLAISGHINRALLYGNNGASSRLNHVDNANSNSRVRFEGLAPITKEFKIGATLEGGIAPNSSDVIDIGQTSNTSTTPLVARKLEIFFDHTQFGKISIGQGHTASYEIVESDLSGTFVMTGGATANFFAGGMSFFNSQNVKGPTVVQVFANMDGLGRSNRIRYDTPQLMGFKISTSHVQADMEDVALRYAGEIATIKLEGGVAFANDRKGSNSKQTSGSLSLLHPTGLNLTFGAGVQRYNIFNRRNGSMRYIKLGYLTKFLPWGNTAFAIDCARGANINANSFVSTIFGAYLVQNIDKAATELYIGARKHKLSSPNQNFRDIVAVMSGARVKF